MQTRIHYRVGNVASGKTYAMMKQISGENNLFIEATKRRKVLRNKTLSNADHYYGFEEVKNDNEEMVNYNHIDMKNSQSTTITDYLFNRKPKCDNIIIEDFNEFIRDLFPNKNVYININPSHPNVKYELMRERKLDSPFREFMKERGIE